jgi:hypothetical protein
MGGNKLLRHKWSEPLIFLRCALRCFSSQQITSVCWEQLRASLRRVERTYWMHLSARLRSPCSRWSRHSESQFKSAFAEAFNLARKNKGLRPLEPRDDAGLHELACITDGSAAKLSDKLYGVSAIVVFTSSDPHYLPQEINPRIANAYFHSMRYGVCFRPDQQHGYANFWIVAAFAN